MLDISIHIGFTPDTLKTLDNLAESLRAFAGRQEAEAPPKAEPEAKEAPTQAAAPPIDYTKMRNDVVAIVRANVRSEHIKDIKALLTRYGAEKVSGLKNEQLEPFAAELKALVAA